MQGSIQPRLESMERSALTQEDGAEHQGSCQPSPAQPSSCRTAASASHGRVGGQQELPESPLPPACCRTAAPGSSGGSPRDSAPIPPQSTAWERAQSTHTGCGLWGAPHPGSQQQCPSPRVPHAASHRAKPVHVSRDSHTFVGALPEQPANAKGSAGCIHTQDKECSSLLHQPGRFSLHCSPSPTHISFVPPFLIPTFLCCPPTHPLRYPTACPSTLFSKFTSQPSFLWDLLQSEEQELKWGNSSLGALSPSQSLVLV